MAGNTMDRKEFMATLGRTGARVCMCGAVLGMTAAAAAGSPEPERPAEAASTAGEPPPSKPGDKSAARAVKRMEFVDGWVPRFFHIVDEQLDEPTRRRLMAANGKACFCAWAPNQPRRPEPATAERIAAWVAERGQAAGYSMDGDTVVFEYLGSAETGESSPEDVCLCPTVEAQNARTMSPTYCWCSVGYVKEMHERIFGRTVVVELARSVLMGDKRCQFRITPA
ncbi:MAG: DUF6144 family protein [Candidatus Eisenbacteria bacterium]|jgi:hypothetical protein|nr:DUF6144 family protein [Candidatus Eisenbacteria bacterium]